jgi:hypothetical protein
MMRLAIFFPLLVACTNTETVPRESDAAIDAVADTTTVTDAVAETTTTTLDADSGDAGPCCPISETPACCMMFGGAREGTTCGSVCDNIPADLERRVDDAGCPFWYDPPGGTTTCGPSPPPPDSGAD